MKTPNSLAFILLAAGESTRLGQEKQLVKYGNESLLRRQIKMLLKTTADVYCVLGHETKRMAEELTGLDVIIYTNEAFKNGLGSSIAFATEQIPRTYDAIGFIQVDQWRLQTTDMDMLIQKWQQFPNKILICQDQKNNFGPPVIFPRVYFNELATLEGKQGAKKIVAKHPENCQMMVLTPAFDDIDTPKQLAEFKKLTQ
jgi:molybdenum cofactor cytidylyltransferase